MDLPRLMGLRYDAMSTRIKALTSILGTQMKRRPMEREPMGKQGTRSTPCLLYTSSLVILAPRLASALKPGQFVNVRVPGDASELLRIPLSYVAADPQAGTVEIWYAVVGNGTQRMSEWKPCLLYTSRNVPRDASPNFKKVFEPRMGHGQEPWMALLMPVPAHR